MPSIHAAIDTGALLEVILASLIATSALSAALSLTIVAAARLGEVRRQGRARATAGYATLTLIAGAIVVAGVVFGLIAMTSK